MAGAGLRVEGQKVVHTVQDIMFLLFLLLERLLVWSLRYLRLSPGGPLGRPIVSQSIYNVVSLSQTRNAAVFAVMYWSPSLIVIVSKGARMVKAPKTK